MNETLRNDEAPTILDHVPVVLGRAVVEACLASFPVHLLCFSFTANMASSFISMRSEEKIKVLLSNLKDKIDSLEKDQKINKKDLKNNLAYQEVAHKRLSALSTMDTEKDIKIIADLIALCGTITGDDPKDKFLLRALSEINPEEIALIKIINAIHNVFEKKKSEFSYLERQDAECERELKANLGVDFFNQAEALLSLYSFTHILSRIHSLGLIEALNVGGFSTYNQAIPSIYPPALTPVGHYFMSKL